jgi:hypothetical protein
VGAFVAGVIVGAAAAVVGLWFIFGVLLPRM